MVAGTFDAEPLYVTGAALVLLGAGAAAWIGLGAWGASVQRTVGKRSVVEEEPLAVLIEAVRGRLPLPPGWIDEPLLPEPVRLSAGRSRARVRAEVTFARRGRRVLAPPALVLRDPFGLAQRVLTGAHADEVLVLPRVLPVRAAASGGDGIAAHARAALIAAAETEIDGLREHREGTPASRIHWPTVARGAGLMERKLISEADSRPLVVLDPRAPASQDALDAVGPRGRVAHGPLRAQDRLRAAAARRPPRGHRRPRPAGVAAGARAARADGRLDRPGARGRAEPARAGRVRRRARRRPAAARSGTHAGRLPDRRPRRDRRAHARCSRSRAARASSPAGPAARRSWRP